MARNKKRSATLPEFPREKQIALDLAVVQANLYHGGATIYAFHEMTHLGILHSKRGLASHAQALIDSRNPDPGQLKEFKMHKLITELTADSAKGAADAAVIIYAHAVLDAVLHKLCKICALVDQDRWLQLIEQKEIKLHEAKTSPLKDLEQKLLAKYLARLEHESLLAKCDLLFRVMRPPSTRRVLKGFRYSRNRLAQIDRLRHDLVHRLGFHTKSKQALAKVKYLFNAGHFLHNLVVKHYRLATIFNLPNSRT